MRRDRGTFVFGREPETARYTARPDLLSLLLRLIDRVMKQEGATGKEVVFNQMRERENWKALKK